jgi:hypothetical protein
MRMTTYRCSGVGFKKIASMQAPAPEMAAN